MSFDVSGALQGIGQIDDALTQVVQTFSVGLADALTTLTGAGADLTPLAESLDVAGLGPAVDAAIADAGATPIDVTVEGDTAPLTDAIDTVTSTPSVVDVNADTAEASAAIDALNTAPVTVEVDADTSQAQDSLDALGVSATQATGGGSEGLAGLEGAVLGIKAATGAAQGEVGGLTAVVGGLSTGLGSAVAGGVAFTAFLGETVKLAADAQAQQARFNSVFGQSAEVVKNIDVGGLKISLEELGKQSGTTAADLEASASRIGLLGNASGAARPQIAGTASDLLGLAGAIAVANPRLGDTATVADTISRALSTGRTRSLIPYGISLSAVAIQQEALNETQKTSINDLTGYDKLVAGLTLALQQQGNTLGTTFAAGAQNAQVQLRALKVQLEETLVAIGTPLLGPVTESLKELLPVAEEVGRVLGEVAQIILPLITSLGPALGLLASGLGLVADGVRGIGAFIDTLKGPTALFVLGLGALTVAFDTGTIAALSFGAALDFATGPIGLAIAALTAIGVLGLFSDKAQQATIDTTVLSNAFASIDGSTASFTGSIDNVNLALDHFLAKQLTLGDIGKQPVDAVNALAVSADVLKTALTGTDEQFTHFIVRLATSSKITDDNVGAFNALDEVLHQARDSLEAGAHATLTNAIQTGLLTKANVGSTQAWNALNAETGGAIATLAKYNPLIQAAAKAQRDATRSTADASAEYARLSSEIAKGTITTADAAAEAEKLGITEDEAKALIENLTAALAEQHDKQLLATDSSRLLQAQLATGAITAGQAENAFVQMGISVDGAKKIIQDTTTALDQFVSNALAKTGSAGEAISTFGTDLAKAVTDVASAAAKAQGGITADVLLAQDALIKDLDPHRIIDALNLQTLTIVTFQSHINTLIERGRTSLAAALISEGPDKAGIAALQFVNDDSLARATDAGFKHAARVREGFRQDLVNHRAELTGVLVTLADGSVVDAATLVEQAGGRLGGKLVSGVEKALSPQVTSALRGRFARVAENLTPDVTSPSADAAKQAGQEAQAGFVQGFQPAVTATEQVGKIPAAITGNIQPAVTASSTAAQALVLSFASGLHFDNAAAQALSFVAGSLAPDDQTLAAAASAGFSLGLAFGAGFAGGLTGSSADVSGAAGALASVADAAVRRRLGITSPSKVGVDIGQQFVVGIARGMAELTPLHQATAALTLALIPSLTPTVKQSVALAPGIVAAAPGAARTASASNRPDAPAVQKVDATITLNKTDPDPKHFADELAWMIQ